LLSAPKMNFRGETVEASTLKVASFWLPYSAGVGCQGVLSTPCGDALATADAKSVPTRQLVENIGLFDPLYILVAPASDLIGISDSRMDVLWLTIDDGVQIGNELEPTGDAARRCVEGGLPCTDCCSRGTDEKIGEDLGEGTQMESRHVVGPGKAALDAADAAGETLREVLGEVVGEPYA